MKLSNLFLICLFILIHQANYCMTYEDKLKEGYTAIQANNLSQARKFINSAYDAFHDKRTEPHKFFSDYCTALLALSEKSLELGQFAKAYSTCIEAQKVALQESVQQDCQKVLNTIYLRVIDKSTKLLEEGNLNNAKKACLQAIQYAALQSKNYYNAHFLLGTIYEALHKTEPQNASIHRINARSNYQIAANAGHMEAKWRHGALVVGALKKQKLSSDNYFNEQTMQNLEDAEQNLIAITQAQEPTVQKFKIVAHYLLGLLFLATKRIDDAKNHFRAAAEEGHCESMHNCAFLALRAGKADVPL